MTSHATCDHPATKAARAQCRRMRDAGMRGVRNSKRELERSESAAESPAVETLSLSKGKLFAGIWVRLRRSDEQDWQSGHLLSAASDNVRVVLDTGTLVSFEWGDPDYEIQQEIYSTDDHTGDGGIRRSRYSRR